MITKKIKNIFYSKNHSNFLLLREGIEELEQRIVGSMKRIIIKITNLLTDHQRLDLNNMRHIVYQISEKLTEQTDYEFIIVSSGAITSGAKHINLSPDNLAEKQAAASIGQILLFQKYYEFFQTKNHCVGQLLVTKDNFNDQNKTMNIKQTIETLLKNNVIPIINENDSVSAEEIQFGIMINYRQFFQLI